MDGRDGNGVSKSQIIKLVDIRVGGPHLIGLIHRQHHRFPGTEKHVGHFLVGGGEAGLNVAEEHNDRGVLDGDLSLSAHKSENLAVRPRLNTAGIHNIKSVPAPLRLSVKSVPGDPRGVLHNGQALSHQLIKEHGFAHVGPAYNGNKRLSHGNVLPHDIQKSRRTDRTRPD